MGLFEYVFLENGSKISINFLVWNMVSLTSISEAYFHHQRGHLEYHLHCFYRNLVKLFSSVV